MKKGILYAGVVSIAALVWFGWHSVSSESKANVSQQKPLQQTVEVTEGKIDKLAELNIQLTNEIDSTLPKADPKLTTREQQLLTAFQRMQLSVGKFNSASFVKREIQELIRDPQMIEIAKQSLTNFQHAQDTFGEQQALVRVFSIRLLDELAKAGEPGPLYDTTGKLAQTLNTQLNDGQAIEKRRDLDLEDLVYASIANYDEDQVITAPETLMMELGYVDDFHNDIRKIYANEFGNIFNRKKSVDETIEIVQKLFKKQSY